MLVTCIVVLGFLAVNKYVLVDITIAYKQTKNLCEQCKSGQSEYLLVYFLSGSVMKPLNIRKALTHKRTHHSVYKIV